MASVFNPTITNAGQAAAFNADNTGFELEITDIAFGTGSYIPTGNETALVGEVKRVGIASGGMISASQIRMSSVWQSDTDDYAINEIGIYAGSLLFAVWSRVSGGPIGYKTPGVDFVFNYDFLLTAVPPGSVTVLADSGQSAILSIIGDHLADADAHPQYLKRKRLVWCGVASGTANAIELAIAAEDTFVELEAGQEFSYKASSNNTGPVTVKFGTLDPVNVKKSGTTALDADDIVSGALYKLIWDGTNAQITGGVGGGTTAVTIENTEFTATADQDTFSVVYTPGMVEVSVEGIKLSPSEYDDSSGTAIILDDPCDAGDAVLVTSYHNFSVANVVTLNTAQTISGVKTFSNSPLLPTAPSGDNTTKGATTEFVQDAFATNLATESAPGTVEFADATETGLAGSGGGALDRAVSVGRLAALLSSTSARGISRFATNAEAIGSLSNVAVTPAGLNQRIATDPQTAGGTDDVRYITPLKLNNLLQSKAFMPVGMLQHFAGLSSPVGWLLCDGSLQNRATYPDLAAALIKSSVVTMTIASPGVISWTGHPLQNGYPVKFSNAGGALPTGVVSGTTYYVVGKSANAFNIAATAGGTAINTSGSQSGVHTAVCAPFGDGNGTTTFQLPEIRGEHLRAWDFGRGVDINRVFGSAQSDAIKSHTSNMGLQGVQSGSGTQVHVQGSGSGIATYSGDTETRGRNVAFPVYIKAWDATVNQSLIDIAALAANVSSLYGLTNVLHVQDRKTAGVAGGSFVSGSWRTRDLNSTRINTIVGASLAANQITLPSGRYEAEALAPYCNVASNVAILYDVTNSVELLRSSNNYGFAASASGGLFATVKGVFTINTTCIIELRHISGSTQNTDGFGTITSGLGGAGNIEIYSDVYIKKLPL